MARRDDAHVRPDHHIVGDVEPTKVIESAVLIDEDITPEADLVPAGSIEWRDQQESLVHVFMDEIAEQGPNSSASLNVKRLGAEVMAIARLVFANIAADSGVLLWIILVRSSFHIR